MLELKEFTGGQKAGCASRISLVPGEWGKRGSRSHSLYRTGDDTGALDLEERRETVDLRITYLLLWIPGLSSSLDSVVGPQKISIGFGGWDKGLACWGWLLEKICMTCLRQGLKGRWCFSTRSVTELGMRWGIGFGREEEEWLEIAYLLSFWFFLFILRGFFVALCFDLSLPLLRNLLAALFLWLM